MVNFQLPQKRILTPPQLDAFQASATHNAIVSYIETLNESVVGVKLSDKCEPLSEGASKVLEILDKVEEIARATPPVDNSGSRFGNPAFRVFYDKLQEVAPTLHSSLPSLPPAAIPELSAYFNESWGSRTRIDYGSGMELNFLCWLYCLEHLGVLTQNDHKAISIRIFWRYITLMRLLQASYWLEPAGSHGVWGLDDYHFLPFLLGSAQLRDHKYIKPKAIHDQEVVEEYARDYMYFACIEWVNKIKTASLRWHSPMLDDISAVKTWSKVNSGMIKMYLAEVLNKLPVVQHFLFGSILPYDGPDVPRADVSMDTSSPSFTPASTIGHAHAGHSHPHPIDLGGAGQQQVGWGDCCGIPVPSVFGAVAASSGPVPSSTSNIGGRGGVAVESGSLRDLRLGKPDAAVRSIERGPIAGLESGMQKLKLSGPGIRPVPFD